LLLVSGGGTVFGVGDSEAVRFAMPELSEETISP
jgi:hypothetical protein